MRLKVRAQALRPVRWLLGACILCAALPSPAAFTITGVVRNEAGTGLANVDIDLVDLCSGVNVFLVNDKTVADGTFSVVVNPGTYDVRFTPAAGSTVAASEIQDIVLGANANLGLITLHPGFLVSGVVRNGAAAGISGVQLKFVNLATGKRVHVSKDATTATGGYSVRVLPATYDVEYQPSSTTTYLTVRRQGLAVAADVSGLVDTLGVGPSLSGVVRNESAAGVQNVDLNLYDACTGEKVPTAHDNTDAQGNYSVYVPAGTYSIHYHPPACAGVASLRLPGESISANRAIDATLPPGLAVSGRALDNLNQPVSGAGIRFYVGSVRQGATNDNTDALGQFSILMAAGLYGVNVEPPVGRDLVLTHLPFVDVSAPTDLGDIPFAPGLPVTGTVLGPGGIPVPNVNVNAVDSATRAKIRLAHDNTGLDGTFRVVVPSGTYDFQFVAPACTGFAPIDRKTVSVSAPVALGTLNMAAGVHVTGRVVDPFATPVSATDLDFYVPGTGDKFYTPNDSTDAAGQYDVLVQPGAYDILYVPPAGQALRPVLRSNVSAPVNTALPDTVLPIGFLVSGVVLSAVDAQPVPATRVSFYPPGSSTPILIAHSLTAADGNYTIAVGAGTWDLLYTPPAGSGLAPRWRRGVVVTMDINLPDTVLLPLEVPSVLSVTPPSGSTAGGATLTVGGSRFQADATVLVGGVLATNVVVGSATSLTCKCPPHPAGAVSVSVTNPGNQVGAPNGTFTYIEPVGGGVQLRAARSGTNVVLTWISTGQPSYTIFRGDSPTGFTDASILGSTLGTTFTDAGGIAGAGLRFYVVD